MGIADDFHPRPVFLLNITNQCNMSCRHCYNNSGCEEVRGPTYEQLTLVIDKISERGKTIIFNGGEPFIRKDLPDLVEYAHSKGLHVSCRCNGTLFSEENLERISGKVGEVMVSLEGASDLTHDYIRGTGSFRSAINAFDMLHHHRIPIIAGVTLNRLNLREIYKFPELLERFEFDRLAFGQLIPRGRAKSIRGLCLSLDELKEVDCAISGLKEQYSPRRISRICTIGGFCRTDELYTLTLDGGVCPCFTREDLAKGNILVDDLDSLLNYADNARKTRMHNSIMDFERQHSSSQELELSYR